MGWNGRKMSKPVGSGDLSQAFGISSLDLGSQIVSGIIRPMSKYKPVRHSGTGELSQSDRAYARYGFGANLPALPMGDALPQNDWVYQRPRGKDYSEWFRYLDADGYVNDSCAPLVLSIGTIVNDGTSHVTLYGNGTGNGVRSDGYAWASDESLSLAELLQSASDYYNHYISFILVNGSNKALIVTGTTVKSFVDSGAVKDFQLSAPGMTDSGVDYTPIGLLQNSKSGDTVTVIACLAPSSLAPTSTSIAYKVYTSNLTQYTVYSLGFVAGCDRASSPVTTTAFRFDGVTFTLGGTLTNMVTETYYGGSFWRAYKVQVTGVFDMSGAPGWNPSNLTKTLSGTISLTSSYPFGSSPGSPVTINTDTSADLYPSASGQTRTLFLSSAEQYLWVLLTGAGGTPQGSVSVAANVNMTTPLNNPISKSVTITL